MIHGALTTHSLLKLNDSCLLMWSWQDIPSKNVTNIMSPSKTAPGYVPMRWFSTWGNLPTFPGAFGNNYIFSRHDGQETWDTKK